MLNKSLWGSLTHFLSFFLSSPVDIFVVVLFCYKYILPYSSRFLLVVVLLLLLQFFFYEFSRWNPAGVFTGHFAGHSRGSSARDCRHTAADSDSDSVLSLFGQCYLTPSMCRGWAGPDPTLPVDSSDRPTDQVRYTRLYALKLNNIPPPSFPLSSTISKMENVSTFCVQTWEMHIQQEQIITKRDPTLLMCQI